MAKVITFSRKFPAYHPKKGQPTYFVEKVYASLGSIIPVRKNGYYFKQLSELNPNLTPTQLLAFYDSVVSSITESKVHTIRAGNRWKAGDYFSPRVWSGKPYNSPMVTIAPDTLIVNTWDIVVVVKDRHIFLNDVCYTDESYDYIISELAKNDGLTVDELEKWFNKPMECQIICWSNLIEY